VILRIHTSKSAAEAIKYLTGNHALQEARYYTRDGQEFRGNWGGKGAEMLGLKGEVNDEFFASLLNNLHPLTGKQLTPRMRDDRRPGFDLNFNAPKSVSLAYAYTKDDRIVQAFRQMHFDVLLAMERDDAATRVRENGVKDEDRHTGVLVYAENIHLTARPEGGIPDPHLHSHLYVPNLTFDGEEERWKALQMGRIHKKADYYNWLAVHLLGENLKKLGLEIVATKDGLEIAGISKEFRDKFSRRTKTIEEEAIRRGVTDPVEKAKLGALTREKKIKDVPTSEFEPFWWGSLTGEEKAALDHIKSVLQRSQAKELAQNLVPASPGEHGKTVEHSQSRLGMENESWVRARTGNGRRRSFNRATVPSPSVEYESEVTDYDRRAVALGVEHVFERNSVVSEHELVTAALKTFCVGQATQGGIWTVVRELPFLRREVDGEILVTTREILAEEKQLALSCLRGKNMHEPLNKLWKIEDEMLNAQQRAAVIHVLNSRDWITGVAGLPGVGKTTLMRELRRGIEAGFHRIIALAPTSNAAREVLRSEGFQNAETVAKLLRNKRLQEQAREAVWLVDEAGLLPIPEAMQLLALATELKCRVVFLGDIGQHQPVERGQAFDHLQKAGRMDVAQVTEIVRQRGANKRFVRHLMNGDIERAFMTLDAMDAIFEMPLEERKKAIAKEYVETVTRGETTQVVAPTHAECREVTAAIRENLKEKGMIKGGVEWDILRNLGWTDAQKMDCDHYREGMIVQFNAPVKHFEVGQQVEVTGVRDSVVRVRCKEGMDYRIRPLPLGLPDAFSVHEKAAIELCEGERIRFTGYGRNAQDWELNNGTEHVVDYIDHAGRVVLENGCIVDKGFKHLDYCYAITDHAAQGKTVDRVLVAQSAQLSHLAGDLRGFGVATTRGRKGVKVYCDSIEILKDRVSERRDKPMAMDVFPDPPASEVLGRESKEWQPPKIAAQLAEVFGECVGITREREAAERSAARERASARVGREREATGVEMIRERSGPEQERERDAEMEIGM